MAIGGVVGAITNTLSSAIAQKAITGDVDEKSLIVAAVSGFVSGAVAASPMGIGGQIVASGIISIASYLAESHIKNEEITPEGYFLAAATGAFSGLIGGDGLNYNLEITSAITKVNTTRTFASVMYSPREARSITAKVIIQNQKTVGKASTVGIGMFALGSMVSSLVNTYFGNRKCN